MIKEIRYNGYTATPSDYECPDGDLETAIGVVAEDGGLQVVLPPKLMFTLPEGRKVWFIHTTSAFTHYIVTDETDGYIYWYDAAGNAHVAYDKAKLNPTGFNAIGNTLIAFSSGEIHYLLWKNDAYLYLGNKIPDVDISFGLKGHPRLFSQSDDDKTDDSKNDDGTFKVEVKDNDDYTISHEWSDDTKSSVTNRVMAKLNSFIAEHSVNSGRQCFPFMLRYALRMYDGTLTCHSAPILMMPGAPIVTTSGNGDKKLGEQCDILLVAADIDYKIISDLDQLQNWSDIITSVDVFISKPIYTYDQSGECDMFAYDDFKYYHKVFVGSLYKKGFKDGEDDYMRATNLYCNVSDSVYAEWDYGSIYGMYFKSNAFSRSLRIHLPEYSEAKMQEQYLSTSNFYLLDTIKLEDMTTARTVLEVADDYLQSLVAREVLTDDYLSHDKICADYSFVYNQRLSLSGITRYPYKGFSPASLFCYRNANAWLTLMYDTTGLEDTDSITSETPTSYIVHYEGNDGNVTTEWSKLYDPGTTTIDVYLNDNYTPVHVSNSFYVAAQLDNLAMYFYKAKQFEQNMAVAYNSPNFFGAWLTYPNVNATRMVITNSKLGSYEVKLKAHDYLNCAVAYIPATTERNPMSIAESSTEYKDSVEVPNKIYTSEVSNPFHFSASNINTIGTGSIMGLCTAAKALSQGQFGAFPLYAFSTDGVWALTVNETTGGFSAKQPITMDVCISPESITQIDSSVLFATDRGIMLLSGSNTTCISDVLNLSQSTKLVNTTDEKILNFTGIDDIEVVSFITYLRGCRMVYDYVHQHIIVYNTEYKYAYIYSFKSKKWGLINSNIASSVNSYPNALVMDSDNNLVDYSASDTLSDDETADFTLITRPIKLDSDALKTVDTIIQRGYFQKGNIQTVLLGSRDLYNWFTLMSSQDHYLRGKFGTPYKYFKIIVKGKLESNETVVGCTVQYTPRLTNRPR